MSSIKSIRCAQIKILSRLLSAPLYKLSIYIHTEFDKMFCLGDDEKDNFDLAWAMLEDEGMVYTDEHETGIKSGALPVVNCFCDDPERSHRLLSQYNLSDQLALFQVGPDVTDAVAAGVPDGITDMHH